MSKLVVAGVIVMTAFTLANAAANMMPAPRPTAAELRAADRAETIAARKDRIAALSLAPACTTSSHELARLLVQDGRFVAARVYADTYEVRCGADPVVRHWGDAPVPRALR